MKKIFNILFAVSLLSVACTKEVPVTRDHDINAEVVEMQTKQELSTLYCNLTEATALDLQKFSDYLTEKNADVALLVSPASVGGDFKAWLEAYAAASVESTGKELVVLESTSRDDADQLTMAALVNAELAPETYSVSLGKVLDHAVLHFKAGDIHFVVTELLPAVNTIPEDWEAQIDAMIKNKKEAPLAFDPDLHAERITELEYLLDQTLDNEAFLNDSKWYWAINMNAESNLDLTKYNIEFVRADYYNGVTEEFYTKANGTKYFNIEETLDASDNYFGANSLLLRNALVDCNAVHHSVYTPSSIGNLRRNFLYASFECWNMFQSFDFDSAVATDLGVTHYPIIVTLKSEE